MIRGAILAALAAALSGCAPNIAALSQDPATLSVHQEIVAPGYSVKTDVTRVNSTGTAATSGPTGTAVNVPSNSVVNPAPAKPASGTTLTGPTASQ